MRKGNASHLEKELQMSLENSTKKNYDDNEQDESEQELGEDENKAALMCNTTAPMR